MIGALDGAADRAVAAVRALARAQESTASAAGLLRRADDVDWTGPASASYRDEVARVLDGVRRVPARLGEAEVAAADHLAAVREEEEARAAEARRTPLGALLGRPALPDPGAVG